ncbi:MAG TPA: hypothetical protein VFL13_12120, partial [Candidatus Baltobacteraceae bacterium]|nr:hypothetical protein [Candidatus Baltobacteraceae bacterium]
MDSGYREREQMVTIIIEPGKTFRRDIPMLHCDVLSDPCTQTIKVTAGLSVPGTTGLLTVHSNSIRYQLIPDPTATYQIGNLNGNRPIFLSQGVGSDAILPDSLVVEATAAASEPQPAFAQPPPLANDLAAAFRASGVSVGGVDYDATDKPWKAQVFLDRVASQRASVESAIQSIRQKFASRITSLVSYIVFDSRDAGKFDGLAEADARRQVIDLTQLTGSGIQPFSAGVYVPGLFTVPDAGEGFPYGDPGTPEDARRLIIHGTTLNSTQVQLVRDFVFIGETPVLEQHDPLVDARARAIADVSSLPTYKFGLKVPLAADR